MAEVYKNYIGGKWVEAVGKATFENRNPARKTDLIGIFQKSTSSDVELAVEAAKEALPKWKTMPAPRRAEIIFKAGQLLMERKEQLARDMTREMGKVLKEARGDVQEAIDMAFYAAGEGRRLLGETTPSEMPNKFCMTVRMPVGIVAAITPWNFPMAIPSWKLLPALVCGNTVVFKPASDTPLSGFNLVKILAEAGLPPGVLNLVHGTGSEVGRPMAMHPEVKLVSFTGSSDAGKEIALCGAETWKKVSLELGGKNAIIVMDDADIDLAVEGAVWGGFGTTGQRCTAASRVVVHKAVLKEFIEKFLSAAKSLRLGDGMKEGIDVGPVINEGQLKKIDSYTRIGLDEGAKLLCGGKIYTKGECAEGYFYEPTIFGEVDRKMRVAREEIFGPTVVILAANDLEEAIDVVNDSLYGLSSAIYTKDVNKAFVAMRDLYTGVCYVNSSTIGAEIHLPFGGTNRTGNGHREAGRTVLDIFTEWKAIFVDYSGKLQKAQIDR